MDDDGFTTVRRSGRERGNRSLRGAHKEKKTSNMSYTIQEPSRTKTNALTTEQKLVKVLAILETRKRQLIEEAGNGGKGKEKSFLASWTGKQMCRTTRSYAERFCGTVLVAYEIIPDQLAAVKSVLRNPDVKTASSVTTEPRFSRIICLGIGITNESRESQFQFVLLDMLQEAFEVSQFDMMSRQRLITAHLAGSNE
jgi:hypothetical protein